MSSEDAEVGTGDGTDKGKGFISEGSSLFHSTIEGRVISDFRVSSSGSVHLCGSMTMHMAVPENTPAGRAVEAPKVAIVSAPAPIL